MSLPERQIAGSLDPEVIECPNCGAPNAADRDYCRQCRIVLRSSAEPDWLSQTDSGEQVGEEARDEPMSPTFFRGMWLVFGPWVVFTALFVLSMFPDVYYGRLALRRNTVMRDGVPTVVLDLVHRRYAIDIAEFAFGIIILLAPCVVLYQTTKSYFRRREPRHSPVCRRALSADKWYVAAVGLCCASAWIAVWASKYDEVWIDWREALRFYLVPLTLLGGPALVVVGAVLLARGGRRQGRARLLCAATLGALAFTVFWWWFCLDWRR